jgi:4-amino-4-deoxy-L-arabinose transferase-like glycosyltransferase
MSTASAGGKLSGRRIETASLAAIAWALILTGLYAFWYEAWLNPVQAVHLVDGLLETARPGPHAGEFLLARLGDALFLGLTFLLALGAGAATVGRLVAEKDLFGVLFTLGIGLWMVAVAVLCLGAFFSVQVVSLVYVGLLCWALPGAREFARDISFSSEKLSRWSKLMLALAGLAALLSLPGAMAPPFEYDELSYHLGVPADYLRAERIVFLPHNFFSNLSQLTEMLYLLAITLRSGVAAKLLHWSFGVMTALAVYAVGMRMWSRNVGATAAALFYCLPFVYDLGVTARIDLATAFFGTLSFGALLAWWDGRSALPGRLVWVSALAAGGAVATKWTAIPVVAAPCALFVLAIGLKQWRSGRGRALLRPLGYGLAVMGMATPWFIKNWAMTGNPVYPMLGWIFPTPGWGAEQFELMRVVWYPRHGAGEWLQALTLPWRFSFPPHPRLEYRWLGEPLAAPLLLLTAPLALFTRKMETNTRRTAWLLAATYAAWALATSRPWRFLLPGLPLAALLGGYALEKFARERAARVCLRPAVTVTLAMCLSLMLVNATADVVDPQRYPQRLTFVHHLLGRVSKEDFVARMGHGSLGPVIWMNQNLPASAKVLYVGEARLYYGRHEAVWATAFDPHPLTDWAREADSVERLLEKLSGEGVTHVYVNRPELRRLRAGYGYLRALNWEEIEQALQAAGRAVHQTEWGAVYRLDD